MATPEADARSLRAVMTMAALVGEATPEPGDAFLTGLLAGALLTQQHPDRAARLVEMLAGIISRTRGATPDALMTTWLEATTVIAGIEQEPLDKTAQKV